MQVLNDDLKKLVIEKEELSRENEKLKNQVNELNDHIAQVQQQAEKDVTAMIEQTQAKDQELRETLGRARNEFEARLEEKDHKMDELAAYIDDIRKELEDKKQENDYLKEQLQDLEQHFTGQIKELVDAMEKAKEDEIVNHLL